MKTISPTDYFFNYWSARKNSLTIRLWFDAKKQKNKSTYLFFYCL